MNAASREFQVMVKPIGAVCNLDCRYCYYLEKKDLYPGGGTFRMDEALLERYIVQHIAASPTEAVLFSWHGGEPTVLGLDYFRKIVELQRKHRPEGREILNGIQTNGTLLDEDWARFLAENKFYVGLSLDGPKELHDCYRFSKGEKPTHKSVMQALRLLQKHRVHFDVLCVVHQANVRQPAAVYRFFKEAGVRFLQFLPLVNRAGDGVSEQTVSAAAYGDFLCAVFDEWVRRDLGRIVVQNFDEALRPHLGLEHALCISRKVCGNIVVLEHNGDVYSCDHFVNAEHRLGNIRDASLVELLESPALLAFGEKKRDSLPRYCRECEVLDSCNGGCPKDRFIATPDGEAGLNYLCAGLKRFYIHSRPMLQRMAWLRRSGESVEKLMQVLAAEETAPVREAGRNDPCPCGSGKKFKKCCLAKAAV